MVILVFLTALPPARAQIVPVSLTKPAADSKIPSGIVLAPLFHNGSRDEVRKAVRESPKRLFLAMSLGVYVAAGLDAERSESSLPKFDEQDPLARPLLRLPAPAYYASAALFATGINWLGWKMARSERWHKIWWLPQVTSMAGNFGGYGYTREHLGPR